MTKILHFISDVNIGGAGRLLLNLVGGSDKKSFCHSVILPRGSLLAPRLRELGVTVIESPKNMNFIFLYKVIRHCKPHVVHTHAAAAARVAARLCGVPLAINTKHCADDTETPLPFFKRVTNHAFDALFTDRTIATAKYVETRLKANGIPPKKISVIINGSPALRKFSAAERAEVRRALGYSEGDFVAGIVARLEDGKGHETFIEAARYCQKKYPRIKFLVVGSGSAEKRLQESARGLDNLKFIGFIEDVTAVMNVLDANVNCSYISETSSLSLSEGMSVGAVPVVTDCGGNSFMAEGCGIIFRKKDSLALAKSLIFLHNTPQEAARLSRAASERFFKQFTAAAMAKDTERLYLELLNSR